MEGEPVAFTRGGFICPFTTERQADLIDTGVLAARPGHGLGWTLCGEVVGPESPYNTEPVPYVAGDVAFLSFDIMDDKGGLIPPKEKYSIFQRLNLPAVRHWGPFAPGDVKAVKDLLLELDREGREGMVVKPPDEGKAFKYVTPSSCLRDIEATARLFGELPAGFYAQRIMRAIFWSYEFGLPLSDEFLLRISKALYEPNLDVLREIEGGGSIRERFRVRVRKKETIEELIHHLKRAGVEAHLVSVEKSGEYLKAEFYRLYRKGTKELRRRLQGRGFFD